MSTHLKTLIGKLNDACRTATEGAARLCTARGHHEVEVEHLFVALLDQPRCDLTLRCRRDDISTTALRRDLEAEIGRFKAGNTRTPVFSTRLPTLFEHAWLIASLDTQHRRIRSAHLLLALLTEPGLRQLALRVSPLFGAFKLEALQHQLAEASDGSCEAEEAMRTAEASAGEGAMNERQAVDPAAGKTPALDQYTTQLTERAREGRLDPVIGREAEIRQTIDILMRRRQNNPILTGEAGVGKTAVVEGLALRIAAGDVPPPLQGVELHMLDMGLLQAGASVKGEFENRLKNVIDEVKRSPHPIILFIDEAHTMIGAGGVAGQNDAANLLKPALARGELRTVAATTWSEYKRYFEKDAALARRFQVVKVEEPSEAMAAAMLRAMVPLMERHFKVRVHDEAITEAVRLSARYITGRQLPDKAIGILDTACAKVALGHSGAPAVIEDQRKELDRLGAAIAALEREAAAGMPHAAALDDLRGRREKVVSALASLTARHDAERRLVEQVLQLRRRLESEPAVEGPAAAAMSAPAFARAELRRKLDELAALQGNAPLIPVQVDGHVVAEIVAAWTGIPLGKMVKDEIGTVLGLEALLEARVLGQNAAIEAVAQRVRTARANLEDPHKPKGVFLFVGPSGVGKTETALALADILYGGEKKLITINMSEYQEAHSVSGLKGSPPGYVGYGEGGVLTDAVRRSPHCVLLLDEVEKAHPDVLELFFQVFDKGVMDDAEGREIDFRHCLIILTSNVGSQQIMQACLNKRPEELPSAERLAETLRPALYKHFKPAFIGRVKIVPYFALDDDVLERIVRLKLDRIGARVARNHRAAFRYDTSLVEAVLARCTEVDSGARNVDHILNGTLLPRIAEEVLGRMATGEAIARIEASATRNGDLEYTVT